MEITLDTTDMSEELYQLFWEFAEQQVTEQLFTDDMDRVSIQITATVEEE